ncbi:MAG: hypothetical protein QXJ64_03230 [Thermosphaera sp.]
MPDSIYFGIKHEETKKVTIPCVNCGKTEFDVTITKDMKDTLLRYLCPDCKASTYVYITPNLDIIVYREDELCPECKGTGKCSSCDGTGKMKCPTCKGEGIVAGWFEYYGCPDCGGKGVSINPNNVTKGSGFVTCRKCLGSGICSTCKGYRGTWGRRYR